MSLTQDQLSAHNQAQTERHERRLDACLADLSDRSANTDHILDALEAFQVAIPSWALGAGGTRFGRFSFGGEPGTLQEKIADVGLIHQLTQTAGAISLHIPWDIPEDAQAIKALADSHGLAFDAVNSNTFQDQAGQSPSYKFGSLSHVDAAVRQLAIDHNKEVIDIGTSLGSKSLTVWLADGASFPGQSSFRKALENTLSSLQEIYAHLPEDWSMFVEYKPYEPNFYSTVIQDWGTSHFLASELGEKAYCLVDLGHHLPNTNIEQIVATLMMRGKLGGFHFNDSKYGDDDLTVGAIKPYQLFLIFHELVKGMNDTQSKNPPLAWMIDASHNLKDPLEDLIQSLEAIQLAYAQALLVDQQVLDSAQASSDPVLAQEILQDAYRTDLRPLVAEARRRAGGAIQPIMAYREANIRQALISQRGTASVATGL